MATLDSFLQAGYKLKLSMPPLMMKLLLGEIYDGVMHFNLGSAKSYSFAIDRITFHSSFALKVIEHKPYDHKADLPYEYLTPLQAAVGVVQKGLRPTIPKQTHPKLTELLEKCWQQDPALRPDFSEIIDMLLPLAKEIGDEGEERRKSSGGFLSVLRRGHH
ncbi:hypothetical protein ACLB2K_020131 [Fragaria x ananassa]